MDEHEKPRDFRPFKDIGRKMAFYEAVTWLRQEGLAQGYGGSGRGQLFRPHQPITRGELSKLLYQYDQKFGEQSTR